MREESESKGEYIEILGLWLLRRLKAIGYIAVALFIILSFAVMFACGNVSAARLPLTLGLVFELIVIGLHDLQTADSIDKGKESRKEKEKKRG